MNKKVFLIFFLIIILSGFAYIINLYLKQKLSSLDEFSLVVHQLPENELSRIEPIQIHLAQEIDLNKFTLNVPLKKELISFRPSIKGYAYFTDAQTLEFQPNTPLPQGKTFYGTIDFSKIFPNTDLPLFRFRFETPSMGLNIKTEPPIYSDIAGTKTVQISGILKFTDFIEIPSMLSILSATQGKNQLKITYLPDIENNLTKFTISNLSRSSKPEPVKLYWKFKNNIGYFEDSTLIDIIPENTFELVNSQMVYFPKPALNITFSENIQSSQDFSNLIKAKFLSYNVVIDKNILTINFDSLLEKPDTLILKNGIKSTQGFTLTNNITLPIIHTTSADYVQFMNSNLVFPMEAFNHLLSLNVLNLKQLEVTITFIPDENVLQFLQINPGNGGLELNRVGKQVFKKEYVLSNNINYNPNQRVTYDLPILGVNFNENGIYHFEVNYQKDDRVNIEITNSPIQYLNPKPATQNYMFIPFNVIAKRTVTDSVFVFVHELKDGKPIKNARVEVYNYQKQYKQAMVTSSDGHAAFKSNESNIFVKVIYNNRTHYLKIANDQNVFLKNAALTNNNVNKGILTQALNVQDTYYPGDSLHVPIIIQNQNTLLKGDKNIELKLESPQGFFFNKTIVSQPLSGIVLFRTKLKYDVSPGTWYIHLKIDDIVFRYPFQVSLIRWHAFEKPETLSNAYDNKTDSITVPLLLSNCPANIGNKPIAIKIFEPLAESTDLLKIKIKAPFKGYSFITIDNGIQIKKYWEDLTHNDEKIFSLNRFTDLNVGDIISVYHFNNTASSHGFVQFKSYKKIDNLSLLTFLMPHDWEPTQPTPLQVINSSGSSIQYYLAISSDTVNQSIPDDLQTLFNSAQPNQLSTFDINCKFNAEVYSAYSKNIALLKHNSNEPFNEVTYDKIYGPFRISPHSTQNQIVSHSGLPQYINIHLIGITEKTGELMTSSKPAHVNLPINLDMVIPEFAFAGNSFSTFLAISNNTPATDTLALDFFNIKNLDISFTQPLQWIIPKHSTVHVPITFKIKWSNEKAGVSITANTTRNTFSKQFEIPVIEPPVNQIRYESDIIHKNGSWHYTMIPSGIKGTNASQVQLSKFEAPDIKYILHHLNQVTDNQLSNQLNYALPLLSLKKITPELISQPTFNQVINRTNEQLFICQQADGGFSNQSTDTRSDLWLSCVAGWYMIHAANDGFVINQGVYNRWIRYIQKEYQKFSYLNPYIAPPGYLLYSLALSNTIKINELQRYSTMVPPNTNVRLYLAQAFVALNRPKLARHILTGLTSSTLSEFNLIELAIALELIQNKIIDINPKTILKNINEAITKSNNGFHISYALFTLGNYYRQIDADNINISYQINHGKKQILDKETRIEFIRVPLEYSLTKFIDIENITSDSLFVNVLSTGKTGSPENQRTIKDLQVNSVLTSMNDLPLLKNRCSVNDIIKYNLTLKNCGPTTYNALKITIAPFVGCTINYAEGELQQNIPINSTNEIITQIRLNPGDIKTLTVYLKPYISGSFILFPAKINSDQFIYKTLYSNTIPLTIN